VLDAARRLFESDSPEVSVEQIAQSAGVGVGTVYRHFPTKSALFDAVVQERLEELVDSLETPSGEDPVLALLGFVHSALSHAGPKRDLLIALETEGAQPSTAVAAVASRLRGQVATLLERAQKAGGIRGDIDAGDLLALLSGASVAASRPDVTPDRLARITAVICDGLRVEVDA
jgi:AcrR family transcriptional regulator